MQSTDDAVRRYNEAFRACAQAHEQIEQMHPAVLARYALQHVRRLPPDPPADAAGRKRWQQRLLRARARRVGARDGHAIAVAAGLLALVNAGGLAQVAEAPE